MAEVELFGWNPRRMYPFGRDRRSVALGRRINNFGDVLGPVIVERLLARRGIDAQSAPRPARLLSVGSVLHFAHDGDTIWGTGANGKVAPAEHTFSHLDVRAVRGPLTRDFLAARGIAAPEIFGDPGLLVGELWSREELSDGATPSGVCVIPNLNEYRDSRDVPGLTDPCSPLLSVLRAIASSELVVGSSLHAIVVADSLGVPARLVKARAEAAFKYEDYYLGSGRQTFTPAPDVAAAIRAGGEELREVDVSGLLSAFPVDLWAPAAGAAAAS